MRIRFCERNKLFVPLKSGGMEMSMNVSEVFDLNLIQKSTGETFPVDCTADLSSIDPAFGVAEIKGKFRNTAGVVKASLKFSGMYKTVCDRCLEAVALPLEATIDTIVGISGAKDDSISIENGKIDIQKTAYDALCLEIPTKVLCREDCRGLCCDCGKNLNFEQCECDN